MIYFILGVIAVIAISYMVFMTRRKALSKAMKVILSGQKDSVVIKQELEKVKNIITAHFSNVISTENTIAFGDKNHTFIVSPIGNNEVLLSLMPSDKEVEEYAKLEKEILEGRNIESKKKNINDIDEIFQEVLNDREHVYNNTPLVNISNLEWLVAAQVSIRNRNKHDSIYRLYNSFIILEKDGIDNLKKFIMDMIINVEDGNYNASFSTIDGIIKSLAQNINADKQSYAEHSFNNFNKHLQASKRIVSKRNKVKSDASLENSRIFYEAPTRFKK